MAELGKTLAVVNPQAQAGRSDADAQRALSQLEGRLGKRLKIMETDRAGHASQLALRASHYDTVIALGGDGLIHEMLQGLMAIDEADRPRLGVVPLGSGNDYARTLGMHLKNMDMAVISLFHAPTVKLDVGRCNDRYFAQTLSFGLDAAIAREASRRARMSNKRGTRLYMEAAADCLRHSLRAYDFEMSRDGGEAQSGSAYLFAIQNGPNYGGGFQICPAAKVDDGMLDLCIAPPPISRIAAARLLLLARKGQHIMSRSVVMETAEKLSLTIEEGAPVQIDGEIYDVPELEISVIPQTLPVLVPRAIGTKLDPERAD